jgi:hypothetical protein
MRIYEDIEDIDSDRPNTLLETLDETTEPEEINVVDEE